MLVLTRKPGQKILIGDNIVLHVIKVSQNQVRLGLDAPEDVTILREELVTEKQKVA